MVVIAKMKDGTEMQVKISEIEAFTFHGPADAIACAKKTMKQEDVLRVKEWQVEEDFL